MAFLEQSKLPVDHPEFRYADSRNPYWKKLETYGELIFSDHATEEHRGSWRTRLGARGLETAPLTVEIGCNAGHVILEWAARHPDQAFIGIDWKYKPIFRAAEKAVRRGIRNILFFRAHAERLPYMFAPGEIDHLCLYFPDPWPKKSHFKHRFVQKDRFRALAPLLSNTGDFHIKTDHPGYFDWMEEVLSQDAQHWEVSDRTRDLHAGNLHPETLQIPEVTLFERLFIRDGIPIHSLKLRPTPRLATDPRA